MFVLFQQIGLLIYGLVYSNIYKHISSCTHLDIYIHTLLTNIAVLQRWSQSWKLNSNVKETYLSSLLLQNVRNYWKIFFSETFYNNVFHPDVTYQLHHFTTIPLYFLHNYFPQILMLTTGGSLVTFRRNFWPQKTESLKKVFKIGENYLQNNVMCQLFTFMYHLNSNTSFARTLPAFLPDL